MSKFTESDIGSEALASQNYGTDGGTKVPLPRMSSKARTEALKNSMMKTPQKKIQEILDKYSKGNYIFRGEGEEHKKVSSGLYRQYCQSDDGNTPINSKYFSVWRVESDIVEKVKRHIRPDALNIEVLTELQHYGGKTALLDFTKDIHIALFFACDSDFDQDGRVILFETSGLSEKLDIEYEKFNENREQNIYTLIPPTGKSPRVIFQSSIFVHTSNGYLEYDKCEIIKIEKELKKQLLGYLSKHFNIKTETIYNDIQGFIQNQNNYTNAEIEFYRGWTKQQEGNHEEAMKDYDKAIEMNPQYAQAYNNRGASNTDLGNYQEAIKDYDKAIEMNPQYAEAYNNRGVVNAHLGQHEGAIRDYDKAIELNPQHADAHYNRGNANAHLGNHEDAIEYYNKAIELNPQHANAYYNRGVAHSALHQYEEAIQDFTEVKRLYEEKGDTAMAGRCEAEIVRINKLMSE